MGAWGYGVYDNDSAADWAEDLADGGLATLEHALSSASSEDYLESPEGSALIAAADVVARLKSGGGEQSPSAETVVEWVQANQAADWQHLVIPALAALERVASPENSELYELWAEADSLQPWLVVLGEIRTRLA